MRCTNTMLGRIWLLVATTCIVAVTAFTLVALLKSSGHPSSLASWEIRGVVRTPGGAPVPYADITMRYIAGPPSPTGNEGLVVVFPHEVRPNRRCHVDSAGRFRILAAPLLPAETGTLVEFVAQIAGPSDHAARRTTCSVRYPESSVELVIDPEPSLLIKIRGFPQAAANVRGTLVARRSAVLGNPATADLVGGVTELAIDATGSVFFPALAAGVEYQFWAQLAEQDSYVLDDGLRAGVAAVRTLPLRRGSRIAGRIEGLWESTADVVILAGSGSGNLDVEAVGTWDEATAFHIRGLPPGSWQVRVHAFAPETSARPESKLGFLKVGSVPTEGVVVYIR